MGLLGTVIEVTSETVPERCGETTHDLVVAEIARLQRVFDSFNDGSALRRWLRGEAAAAGELIAVLELAERWRARSGGAFDPAASVLTDLWEQAAARQASPAADELRAAVGALGTIRRPGPPQWEPPSVSYSLNAIAKGWIVDRAFAAGWATGDVQSMVVNAGGDLVYRGDGPLTVGIEDPFHRHDNAPPLLTLRMREGALATSGGGRRGWLIQGRWYAHVLDPRTGRPADHHASVSVRADDAATADVIATILAVLATDEALAFVETVAGASCCIVASDGTIHRSARWRDDSGGSFRPGW
jgi:FAD:protein FMN transferase